MDNVVVHVDLADLILWGIAIMVILFIGLISAGCAFEDWRERRRKSKKENSNAPTQPTP